MPPLPPLPSGGAASLHRTAESTKRSKEVATVAKKARIVTAANDCGERRTGRVRIPTGKITGEAAEPALLDREIRAMKAAQEKCD